jgi:hypothetical protein
MKPGKQASQSRIARYHITYIECVELHPEVREVIIFILVLPPSRAPLSEGKVIIGLQHAQGFIYGCVFDLENAECPSDTFHIEARLSGVLKVAGFGTGRDYEQL